MNRNDITPIVGVSLELNRTKDNPCRCGSTAVVIGDGTALHAASLRCACGRHRGWLPRTVVENLLETTKQFGKPDCILKNPSPENVAMVLGAAMALSPMRPDKEPKMSTDFDDIYGSKYFSVSDLHGKTQRKKIGKAEVLSLREKDGSTKRKIAVYFDGVEKPLILNQTNAMRMADAYGKDQTKWIGTTVDVYSETTSMGDGVRLRPQRTPPANKPQDKASIIPDEDFDESMIP